MHEIDPYEVLTGDRRKESSEDHYYKCVSCRRENDLFGQPGNLSCPARRASDPD